MNKFWSLLPICLLLGFTVNAQIIVGLDQVPSIGDTLTYSNTIQTDGLSLGNAGPNQVWDFSSVVGGIDQTEFYIDPSVDTSGLFPDANLAISLGQGNTTQFAQVTDSEVIALGLVSNNFMGLSVNIALDPSQTLFSIPIEYQNQFIDDYGFVLGLSDPQPNVDTARVISTGIDTVTTDAYGVLRLPQGDFEVLRLETKSSVETSVEIFLGFFWIPVLSDTAYTTVYSFVSRESKRELARIQIDSLGTGVQSFAWQGNIDPLPSLVPEANFEWEANSTSLGQIDFTDLSSNGAVEWLWDFGDGNTSMEQNPTHIYSMSGDYTVCLTAINSAGNDMSCQTINVDVTPPFPMAAFDYAANNSQLGQIDFTDLSTNFPETWAWDFGDGNMSTQQNPSHIYSFTGDYQVCLVVSNATASDQSCQTINVIATPPPPVAAFTYMDTSSIAGMVHFEDLSTGDPTSWAWDFGDGNSSTEQNPIHTFNDDNTYTVCLIATNDGGSATECQDLFVNVGNRLLSWNPAWAIAPNPSKGKFSINLIEEDLNEMELTLTDVNGRQLMILQATEVMEVDLTAYGVGSYLVSVKKEGRIIGTTRLQVIK